MTFIREDLPIVEKEHAISDTNKLTSNDEETKAKGEVEEWGYFEHGAVASFKAIAGLLYGVNPPLNSDV